MENHLARKFYDDIADKYHWFFSSWDSAMDRQMKELVPVLRKYNVETVLDCACGTGLQSIGLKKQGFNVIGSDLSEGMLNIARENAKKEGLEKITFFQSDFREVRKKVDSHFDAVICMGNSIPHLKLDSHIMDAFKNIFECLHKEGVAIFDIRNFDKMLLTKDRFLPMKFNSIEDNKSITIVYVFDYLDDLIRFNVLYLTEDLITGKKEMKTEVIEYNPISNQKFMQLLKETGFINIHQKEVGANVHFTAQKPQ